MCLTCDVGLTINNYVLIFLFFSKIIYYIDFNLENDKVIYRNILVYYCIVNNKNLY